MGRSATGYHLRTDPYRWDYDCIAVSGNEHRTGAAAIHTVSSGAIGSEQGITSSWDFAKISAGYTVEGGLSSPSFAFKKKSSSNTWTWTRGIGSSNSDNISSMSYKDGAGATDIVVKEHDENEQVIINIPRYGLPVTYNQDEKHSPRWVISGNEFDSESYANMYHCTVFSGFLNCLGYERVYSGVPVAVSHHDSLDASVFAWVNQTRSSSSSNHEINIAVGRAADGIVGKRYTTGIKSLTSPGLACKNNDASGYDCVLAYVDLDSSSYLVRTRRFSVSAGSQYYTVSMDPATYTIGSSVRSANRVAAFHHDGDWWVAMKRMETSDDIYLYKSTNGSTWTYNTRIYTSAITGPTSVGWRTSDNIIAYVKQ
jgi:hypothetical protein